VSAYPTPAKEANLAAIKNLRKWTPLIGYSDHTIGIDCAMAAFIIGARIIEKHFTLAHDLSSFRDHALSATPEEMRELTRKLTAISESLGSGDIQTEECEIPNISSLRRSITAASHLNKGHLVTATDLIAVRPGGGLQPGNENRLIGHKLLRECQTGEMITPDMVK
jgi:sialic acid synthase SpsE